MSSLNLSSASNFTQDELLYLSLLVSLFHTYKISCYRDMASTMSDLELMTLVELSDLDADGMVSVGLRNVGIPLIPAFR